MSLYVWCHQWTLNILGVSYFITSTRVSSCNLAFYWCGSIHDLFYPVGFCSCLQQEQEKKHCEVEAAVGKIASLQAENKKLLLEKENFTADKKILQTEMQMTQKTNRSYQSHFLLQKYFYFWKQHINIV